MSPKPEKKTYILNAGKPQYIEELKARGIPLYVILTQDGELKKTTNGWAVYVQQKRAEAWANDDGDSVMEIYVPLNRPPVFIRKKTL